MTVADFDLLRVQAHQYGAADERRPRRIAAVIDADAGVVGDGALALGVVAEPFQRQRFQVGALLLEHGLDLAPGTAVDARRGPPGLPLFEEGILFFDGLETLALERGALRVLDRVLDHPFAVGVAHPRGIGYDAIVGQHILVDGVQCRSVE